jgi:oligoendopeptidase F
LLDTLPKTSKEFMLWSWSKIEPYFIDLAMHPLEAAGIAGWLADWTNLSQLLSETYQRLYVATTVDTTDQQAELRYQAFLNGIYPLAQAANQKLKEKFLDSGLEPDCFAIPLRNMRAEAELFREANLPLLSEEKILNTEYDRIKGNQTVNWQGEELTTMQLQPVYQDPDREMREDAWLMAAARQLSDRQAINELWRKLIYVRQQLASNAGCTDYREYRWREMLRFDYTPQDCVRFQQAIEDVVVPAAERIYEKRRKQLELKSLRPWDLTVDLSGRPSLHPFNDVAQLEETTARIFDHVDPQLGKYFEVMRREKLLDLDNRKGKAPGGYCIEFSAARCPFIFMNAVGIHEDALTLLHEGGHAFHVFESAHLPYFQQLQVPMEFAEVASMGMELLASPYLAIPAGGFYNEADAARARIEHLESIITFWPYMAVVDAFQHWVYENIAEAGNPDLCDAKWIELWKRFMGGVDWNGLEQEMATGWHNKSHIHQDPFYYFEYGLAQLGALQIWRNAIDDQAGAVAAYRRALSLGGTASLPELYQTAGARFAFDEKTLAAAVKLAEETIEALEDWIQRV